MNIQERYIEQIKYSLRGLGEVQEVTKNNMSIHLPMCFLLTISRKIAIKEREQQFFLPDKKTFPITFSLL